MGNDELSRLKKTLENQGLSPSTKKAIENRIKELTVPVNEGVIKHIENVKSQVENRKDIAQKIISKQKPSPPSPGPQPIVVKPPSERNIPQEIIDNQPKNNSPPPGPQPITIKPPSERSIPQKIIDQQNKNDDPIKFIQKHTTPTQKKQLSSILHLNTVLNMPQLGPGLNKTRSKFYDNVISTELKKSYSVMDKKDKDVFGYKFTEWESIPLHERMYYPGWELKRKEYSPSQKKQMIDVWAKQNPDTKASVVSPTIGWRLGKGETKLSGPLEISFKELDVFKTKPDIWTQAKYELASPRQKVPTYKEAVDIWKSDLRDTLFYSPAERHQRKEKVLTDLFKMGGSGTALAVGHQAGQALVGAALFPVTLTETAGKYISGSGNFTDPISRIKTGKTPSPFSDTLGRSHIGTSGLISTGTSEIISRVRGQGESQELSKFKSYPVLGVASTVGEIGGLYAAGSVLNAGKVASVKVLGKVRGGIVSKTSLNLPTYESFMKYKPSNIARGVWWKGKEKLGYAKYVPEEKVWASDVLSGKTKFAESSGPSKMLKEFYKTKSISESGEILGIHAAPHRFNPITFVKKGTSESPGLSISAYGKGSPHFLKVSGYNKLSFDNSGISLFPKLHRPTAPVFNLKEVFRLPKSLRGASYSKTSKFILKQPKGKYAWIAPKAEIGGPELEAIIRASTVGVRKSNFYYTSFKGVTVPLPRYGLVGKGISKGFSSTVKYSKPYTSARNFLSVSSYSGKPTIPLIRPSYIASSLSNGLNYGSLFKSSFPSSISKSFSYVSSPSSKKSFMSSSKMSRGFSSFGGSPVSRNRYKGSSSKRIFRSTGSSKVFSYKSSPSSPYSSINFSPRSFSSSSNKPSRYYPKPVSSKLFSYTSKSKKRKNKIIDVGMPMTSKYRFREFKISSPLKGVKL